MNDIFDNTVNGHLSDPIRNETITDIWDRFWDSVPKKIGKHAARSAFNKLKPWDRRPAVDSVKPFYEWWRKENPQATWLHPSTYLNQRRWEDEEWQEAAAKQKAAQEHDPLEAAERNIKSGKPYLCRSIGTAVINQLLSTNRVTQEQLRKVGL